MDKSPRDQRTRNYVLMRVIKDYGMGVLITCIGIFLLAANRFGVNIALDPVFRYMFAGLSILYGGFRIYRGYQQNYFDND
jgi:hypothetical protein